MTDEERRKLIARFRAHEVVMWTDIDLAAAELERMAQSYAGPGWQLVPKSMTDEERQRLCEELWTWRMKNSLAIDAICKQVTDEIERLAKELHRREELEKAQCPVNPDEAKQITEKNL